MNTLIIGAEVGQRLAEVLPSATFVESYGEPLPSQQIFRELAKGKYNIAVISYWKCWRILPEIRLRFPNVKTILLKSWVSELDEIAGREGADAVLRVPFGLEALKAATERLLSS